MYRLGHADRSLAPQMAQCFGHRQRGQNREHTTPKKRMVHDKLLKLLHIPTLKKETCLPCIIFKGTHGLSAAGIIAYTIAAMRRFCLLTSVLILLCAGYAHAQPADQRAQQARAELATLRAKIEQVRASIEQGHERHDKLANKLAQAGAAVRKAAERLDTLAHSIDTLKRKVAQLKRKRDNEQSQLSGELDALRAQMRAAYRTGHTNKLRVLLSGEDPARLGRMLVYYEYFAQHRSQHIARLRDLLAELAKRQSALEAEQQKLATERAARTATLAHLKRSRGARQNAIAALEARLQQHKSTLKDYRLAASRLEDLISALDKKLSQPSTAPAGTFAALKGRMAPPVHGPLLAYFGAPKANGKLHWKGQWRAAPTGTPIHAVAAGRVVYVGYMHHYGLIVVLEHADGYFTVYGHTQSSYVSVGDQVTRGQAIALTGTSGGHRRSGVYFEIRKGRKALDPARWLSG